MIPLFRRLFKDRMDTVKKEKDRFNKVIGWACCYIPEEIIYAAGMYPVRIFGGPAETPMADAYLYSNTCSFARSCLEEGLRNNYDFLDGFVAANTCDHMRRLYDIWHRYLNTPFCHMLGLPHKVTQDSLEYFKDELFEFKRKLETSFGVQTSHASLKNAIKVYNKTRSLLKDLYKMRKSDNPPISGSEAMDVVLAGMILPKDTYNNLLEEMMDNMPEPPEEDFKPRILLSGSELDNSEYIRVIEEMGGTVVIDDLCNGTRYFWNLVDEQRDPMEAIAMRYLTRVPCARMRPIDKRIEYLRELIKTFRVDAVIREAIKFCDLSGEEYPLIKEGLADLKIPIMTLDREYSMTGMGQMKTRVQAFLESLSI